MQNLDFNFKPSACYLVLLVTLFLTSMGILAMLAASSLIKIASILVLCFYMGVVLIQYGLLRSSQSILGISHKMGREWQLITPTGSRAAALCGDSTATHLVSVLRFKVENEWRARSCILFRDSLRPGEYRRLMVALRMF